MAFRGSSRLNVGLGYLLFIACAFAHQRHFDGPTPASRLDLLHEIARGKLAIDDYQANTCDKAFYKGHYFSDKAPGAVLLALPIFALTGGALRMSGTGLDTPEGWLVSGWCASIGSSAILVALGGVLLFNWLVRRARRRACLITCLALTLGAAPLPYATMMFSHGLVVGLLAIAMWAIERQNETDRETASPGLTMGKPRRLVVLRSWLSRNRFDVLAGQCLGWALASEYSAGIVALALFAWALAGGRGRLLALSSGALLPLLTIPAYSWACLGTPFGLPYTYQASFPEMKHGLYAIGWPDGETAMKLLFSPSRGLFFWTPLLLMAVPGYAALFRKFKTLFWLCCAAPVMHVMVISGRVWDWPAGPTFGPRLLAPILPLLALPCALGVQRFPRLGMLLAGYSILITTLATLTDACPPFNGHPNPLFDFHVPLLLKGELGPNLGTVCGLPGWLSVALYYGILVVGICWLWRKLPQNSSNCSGLTDPLGALRE